jgi:hypothetical protein
MAARARAGGRRRVAGAGARQHLATVFGKLLLSLLLLRAFFDNLYASQKNDFIKQFYI